MKESFTISEYFNASPLEIYNAWLNSESHSAMTGAEAYITDSAGEEYTAWDGYIKGKNLKLIPGKLINQSWRTSEFRDVDEDSEIEIILESQNSGTLLTLKHSNIPEIQTGYKDGWQDYYFKTMRKYFTDKNI